MEGFRLLNARTLHAAQPPSAKTLEGREGRMYAIRGPHMKLFTYAFLALALTVAMQSVIIISMAHKRLHREFPLFFWYTAFMVGFQVAGYFVIELSPPS